MANLFNFGNQNKKKPEKERRYYIGILLMAGLIMGLWVGPQMGYEQNKSMLIGGIIGFFLGAFIDNHITKKMEEAKKKDK